MNDLEKAKSQLLEKADTQKRALEEMMKLAEEIMEKDKKLMVMLSEL